MTLVLYLHIRQGSFNRKACKMCMPGIVLMCVINQFDISEPRAFRQPNKAVNWLRLGLESRFSAPHPRAVHRSQLTALFGCRNGCGSEMSNWFIV